MLEKTKAVIRHIWHRGAILIIKKFKFLKTKEQMRQNFPGNAAKSRWSWKGLISEPRDYGVGLETRAYEQIEQTMDRVANFTYEGDEHPSQKFTPYQAYAFRTAAAHANV